MADTEDLNQPGDEDQDLSAITPTDPDPVVQPDDDDPPAQDLEADPDSFETLLREAMDEAEEEDDDDDKPADEKPAEGDGAEGDGEETPSAAADGTPPPEAEEPPSEDQRLAVQLMEFVRDPELLNAALAQYNTDDLTSIPIIKDLLGRMGQSTQDRTRNALLKAQQQQGVVRAALAQGFGQKELVVNAIQGALDAFENGEDGELPAPEQVGVAFDSYAKSYHAAQHAQQWMTISDTINSLPEMQALTPQQQEQLASIAGQDVGAWLSGHIEVIRNNLWDQALDAVEGETQNVIAQREMMLTKAHEQEVRTLKREYEAKLKDTSRSERAKLMAEMGEKGSAPRSISKKPKLPETSKETKGNTVEEIFREIHEQALAESSTRT